MNLIFCGTPQFAVPTLARLIEEKFRIDLVVTNPDEPGGRGYELKAPPVKALAASSGLVTFQPSRLKDPPARNFLSLYRPDAIVVVAYGHIIPDWMIALPRLGCINLHASLLPKYRGAAPIPWAIVRGERTTGVTTMRIDAGLDTGDTLLRRETEINDGDTTESLGERLSAIGAELMVETLRRLERGDVVPQPQDAAQATFAPILKKEDGQIDWGAGAPEIARRVRGLRPWPGAYTTFRGENFHIWSARPVAGPAVGAPGTLSLANGRLSAACGEGSSLELIEVQLAGRKRIAADDFANGVRLAPGERLGRDSAKEAR